MLAYFEAKLSEEAPSRNWDGPDACDIEGEEDEVDRAELLESMNVQLLDAWTKNDDDHNEVKAMIVALRGAGTALLRSMYSDAIVCGVLCLESDRLS